MDEEFLRDIDQVKELLTDASRLEKLEDDTLICECFCVNVGDIRRTCAEKGEVDLEQLKTIFGLGTGCATCLNKKDYWINRIF